MFIIYSLVWMACDRIFLEPIYKWFTANGWFKSDRTRVGMAEVSIAVTLGAIAGATVGPFIAVSLTTNIWSWVATAALIFTSIIVSGSSFA